jgi:WD40 repeat protein
LLQIGTAIVGIHDKTFVGRTYRDDRNLTLFLARISDYAEIVRVPFAIQESRETSRPDSGIVMSSDGSALAYGTDRFVVCRRTKDLDIVWTRRIEAKYHMVFSLDITPDGGRVAALLVDNAHPENCYVEVYDGRRGSTIAQVPAAGLRLIALSPDGKLISMSPQFAPVMDPTVEVYDIPSARRVGSVIHGSIRPPSPSNRGNFLIASKFTADDKLLLTSAFNIVRVWTII